MALPPINRLKVLVTGQKGGVTALLSALRDQVISATAAAIAAASQAASNLATMAGIKDAVDAAIADHPFAIAIGAGDVTFETIGVAKLSAIPGSAHVVDTRGYFTPGDGGGARYMRVAADPAIGAGGFRSADRLMPDGSLDTANGGWWRIVPQGNAVYLEQFGGRADTTWPGFGTPVVGSDNLQPLNDAIASVTRNFDATRLTGPIIHFKAAAIYWFSDTINLHKRVWLRGSGTGMDDSVYGTILLFPPDAPHKHGMVINGNNTDYDTTATGVGSAGGTIIDGIGVHTYGASPKTSHAIRMRTRAEIYRFNTSGFGGDGVNIRAYTNGFQSDASVVGNANYFRIDKAAIRCGRYGVNVEGSDANGGVVRAVDVRVAGLGGFRDRSYFGNVYDGIAVDDCGKADERGYCTYDGRVWALIAEESSSGGAFTIGGATVPGTDDTVWYPYDNTPGFNSPQPWVSGQTYMPALAFFSLGVCPINGIYTESLLVHSPNSPPIASASARLTGATYPKLLAGRPIKSTEPDYAPGAGFQTRVGTDFDNGEYLGFFNSAFTAYSLRYMSFRQMRLGNGLDIGLHSAAFTDSDSTIWSASWAKFYSAGSLYTMGQPGGVAYGVAFSRLGIADPTSEANTRRLQTATTVPTLGLFARGHRILNVNPSPGAIDNWVCTTGGGIGGGAWAANTIYYMPGFAISGGTRYMSTLAPARQVNTAYAVGDMFSNRGRNYKVTLAGTTSADIIGKGGIRIIKDGTLQAGYVGPVPDNAILPRSGTTGPVSGSTTVPERDGDVWWLAVPDAVFVANYQPTKTTVTVDLPSIAAGANSAMQTTTVSGAGVGDIVHVTCSTYLGDFVTMRGFVSSTNNVKWFVTNGTASAVDPPSATYNIVVQRYG